MIKLIVATSLSKNDGKRCLGHKISKRCPERCHLVCIRAIPTRIRIVWGSEFEVGASSPGSYTILKLSEVLSQVTWMHVPLFLLVSRLQRVSEISNTLQSRATEGGFRPSRHSLKGTG